MRYRREFNADLVLAVVAGVARLGRSSGVPAHLVLGWRPRPVLAGVNCAWFRWATGTQTLSVPAAVLEPNTSQACARAAAGAMLSWPVGVVLVLIVASLVLIRLLPEVTPADLSPTYWITTGATAITVLAGARLLMRHETAPTDATHPMVAGLSPVLWAFGAWLVPPLVAFSVWLFLAAGEMPYAPPLWSVIFPLGMSCAASIETGTVAHLPLVRTIGRVEARLAVAAGAVGFAGVLHRPGALAFARRAPA